MRRRRLPGGGDGDDARRDRSRMAAFADFGQDFAKHLAQHTERNGPLTDDERRRIRRDFDILIGATGPGQVRVFGVILRMAVAQLPARTGRRRHGAA